MTALNKQALRERYSEKIAPKCQICGAVMTIQRAGAGGVVYGCTGRIDKDGEGYKFAEGRDFADNHYALSRVTVANNYNPDVLALLDELDAAEKRIAELDGLALENIRLKVGISGLIGLGLRYADADVMRLAADAQQSTPTTDDIIENIVAGIGVKGD